MTLITFLILALLATGCAEQPPAEESCNFVQNQFSRRVSWARTPIRFYADESLLGDDPTSVEYAAKIHQIQRAMDVWNDYFERPVFQLIGLTTQLPDAQLNEDGRVVADGYNGIYEVDASYFENSASKDEQARTSISFRGDFIYETDILIDRSERFYFEAQAIETGATEINFESLMIHELGHALGLEHIEDEPSVMNPKLQFGEYRAEITEADFESLACEYQ